MQRSAVGIDLCNQDVKIKHKARPSGPSYSADAAQMKSQLPLNRLVERCIMPNACVLARNRSVRVQLANDTRLTLKLLALITQAFHNVVHTKTLYNREKECGASAGDLALEHVLHHRSCSKDELGRALKLPHQS